MMNLRNEHVFPKDGKWVVRREGNKKISKLFQHKKDALQYASIIATNDGGSVVLHRYNGQFKEFNKGSDFYVRTHKVAPIITGTVEIVHPIVNNRFWPIIETRRTS